VANASGTYGSRSADAGDGWGPSTSVRSSAAGGDAPARSRAANANPYAGYRGQQPHGARSPLDDARSAYERSARERLADVLPGATTARGMAGWTALGVLVAAVVLGAIIDWAIGTHASGGLNILLIIGSLAAILLVRRTSMFTIVVAPPIVYSIASGLILFARSSGLSNHRALIDSASNWLVYGFPTVAGATAIVLIIAGIRMVVRR